MSNLQEKRLGLIGILMMICLLTLSAFITQWLISQYHDSREALRDRLQRLYTGTQTQLMDSLIERHITSSILARTPDRQGERPFIQLITKKAGANNMTESDLQALATTGEDAQIRTLQRDSLLVHGVRSVLIKMGNSHPPDAILPDTQTLQSAFDRSLAGATSGLHARWTADGPGDAAIILKPAYTNGITAYVTGYRPAIIQTILPQLLFSLVLLLLCGLAFYLAFNGIRKQLKLSILKDSLISNISHELKTPVATAKVAIEALHNFNAISDPQRADDYLRMAGWEIERLEAMIGHVLQHMQMEKGTFNVQQLTINISKLLQDLIASMQPSFNRSGIQVTTSLHPTILIITGDPIHLQGAIYNIIDNAMKYGRGEIHIELNDEDAYVAIVVSDNGNGIPKEFSRKIFDQFFRIPSGNVHNVKGYGLGLHYAHFVLDAHNGRIRQTNNEVGGATFKLYLPKNNNP